MSKLPASLLLAWGEPIFRLRAGGPPENLKAPEISTSEAPENVAKSPENGHFGPFQGFFVPETLDKQAESLLRNIVRAFPQLGERHGFAEVDALLAAEAGVAVVFGVPEWAEDVAELPVKVALLPALEEMLEQPLLKKRAYYQLLDLFQQD